MNRPFDYGPCPVGWTPTQLRSFLTRSKETGGLDLPLLSVNLPYGVVLRQQGDGRPAPSEDMTDYQVVHRGDLVVNQLGKPHGALGVSAYEGVISPAYFVAQIGPSAEPRFVHHLLRTRLYISEYERRGKFGPPNQFDISWEQFRSIPVLLPPLETQRAIAEFLDVEIARINNALSRKRRVLELLDEFARAWSVLLIRNSQTPRVEIWQRLHDFLGDLDPTEDASHDSSNKTQVPERTILSGMATGSEVNAMINALRDPVQQQFELLVELRQAVSIAAVTGGSDLIRAVA